VRDQRLAMIGAHKSGSLIQAHGDFITVEHPQKCGAHPPGPQPLKYSRDHVEGNVAAAPVRSHPQVF
jgi:hypothetical protein